MPGPEFFQTGMGHKFYEGTMPRLANALVHIADALEQQNARAALGEAADKVLAAKWTMDE